MSIPEAVQLGVQDGYLRLEGLPEGSRLWYQVKQAGFAPALSGDLTPTLQKLLDTGDVSDHFARLFAEITTVAQASRATFGEQPLSGEQIGLALEGFKGFLNSFRHL